MRVMKVSHWYCSRREAERRFWLSPVLARVAGSADFAGWYALEPGSTHACSWGEG